MNLFTAQSYKGRSANAASLCHLCIISAEQHLHVSSNAMSSISFRVPTGSREESRSGPEMGRVWLWWLRQHTLNSRPIPGPELPSWINLYLPQLSNRHSSKLTVKAQRSLSWDKGTHVSLPRGSLWRPKLPCRKQRGHTSTTALLHREWDRINIVLGIVKVRDISSNDWFIYMYTKLLAHQK